MHKNIIDTILSSLLENEIDYEYLVTEEDQTIIINSGEGTITFSGSLFTDDFGESFEQHGFSVRDSDDLEW